MPITALEEGKNIFQASGPEGDFILRFPESRAALELLQKEARLQAGMHQRVKVQLPDTQIIEAGGLVPPFAVHRKIAGSPLTSARLAGISAVECSCLVEDLVDLFYSLHQIGLGEACSWLNMDPALGGNTQALAERFGKPLWFSPGEVSALRKKLRRKVNADERDNFEQIVRDFEYVKPEPAYMVFGHGDLHGYNMAVLEGPYGCRLNGVFDLGCSGILDIHEDFFRLSLVSEMLLDEVLGAYQEKTGRVLDRQRIGLYYRAFLFYLMADQKGAGLEHLKQMLANHLSYRPVYPARVFPAENLTPGSFSLND